MTGTLRRASDAVDLVVIGGGIHGVGVAQAAAAAGASVVLLEQTRVAAGTSSRSSKLIHGGLRYLESFQLGLVRESLTERRILLDVAPDLVRLVPFHVPIYRETSRRPWKIRAGLTLYALLGNLRRAARFTTVPRAGWDALDGLVTDGLQAVFRYHDGQTDDAALSRAVLRSAESLGARALVPAQLVGAERGGDGWRVRYRHQEKVATLTARALVNAAGPWVERVRALVQPRMPGFELDLVGGTHVELEGTLEAGIYYCEAPSDRRAVFTMPWHGRTLVGTTERTWTGDPADVTPSAEEIDYLESIFRHYFPARPVRRLDAWAGLRVLPRAAGAAFDRPRETTLVVDDDARPTAVAIYGGKLTGYRATALKVLRRLERTLPRRERKADTATLRLEPER